MHVRPEESEGQEHFKVAQRIVCLWWIHDEHLMHGVALPKAIYVPSASRATAGAKEIAAVP